MLKFIKYPKTNQFRQVLKDLKRQHTFVGMDEDGNPIYDNSLKLPFKKFSGTIKIHGSHCDVSYNSNDGIYFQSRKNIITIEKDNFGFAFFGESRKDVFKKMFDTIAEKNNIDTSIYTITICGEFAGKGIQKGVGISNIEKSMFIFGVKISKPSDPLFNSYWVDYTYLSSGDDRIYNVDDFETYEIEIDLNNPELSQNELVERTEKVGDECPVAKQFGYKGIGEGVVYSHSDNNGNIHRFKVKDPRHSVTKTKNLASVDTEKLNSINEFVDYSVTENRFDQGVCEVFGNVESLDIKKMGDFIRWFINDIHSEELDTLVDNGLEPKEVNRPISDKVRQMFFNVYNS